MFRVFLTGCDEMSECHLAGVARLLPGVGGHQSAVGISQRLRMKAVQEQVDALETLLVFLSAVRQVMGFCPSVV